MPTDLGLANLATLNPTFQARRLIRKWGGSSTNIVDLLLSNFIVIIKQQGYNNERGSKVAGNGVRFKFLDRGGCRNFHYEGMSLCSVYTCAR